MSAMELRNFESQLDLLSYSEQLSVMAYLVKLLQKRNEEESDGFDGDAKSRSGLDGAIRELENGEYDTYADFDDFLAEIEHDS